MEELQAFADSLRQYIEAQVDVLNRCVEIQAQEVEKATQCLHDAWLAVRRLFWKALNSVRDIFAAFFELRQKLGEHEEQEEPPRRNWPRPRNQKLHPLLLDRRSRVFRCRNAI